ncbi:MAG TPA: hypothetical protein DCX06_01440 [Opitutae bacterium]|nr:hypothetical protein [Opitutae bacterium]
MNHKLPLRSVLLAFTVFVSHTFAEIVSYEAVFQIDSKTDLLVGETPIFDSDGWSNVSIGDRYIVNFSVDTSIEDTNDTVELVDNTIIEGSRRNGSYQGLLTALSIQAVPANTGTYDPDGTSFNLDTATTTVDEVGEYKSNGNLAHIERIFMLNSAMSEGPPILGGDLSDLGMNFRSIQSLGGQNQLDVLDDRSFTTDPFAYGDIFGGVSSVQGNAEDLTLLTDDILGTGFAETDLGRPLSLRFGEVTYFENLSGTHDLYAWGTFESIAVVPEPANSALIIGMSLGFLSLRRRRRL